jgi:hypothetical protein
MIDHPVGKLFVRCRSCDVELPDGSITCPDCAAIELLVREVGATEVDPQAEAIRSWNADVYARARARREAEADRRGKR